MIIVNPKEREKKTSQIIQNLLAKKGIMHYTLFSCNEEASKYLPGGIYPESGKVLNSDGRIFSFWLDWDDEKQDYTLGDVTLPDGTVDDFWRELDPKDYEEEPYYKLAKKKLGLK